MSKEKEYFSERTLRFLNTLDHLNMQKRRLDDQQIQFDKEIRKEINYALNKTLPLSMKVENSINWNVNCRLQDLTIINCYEQYFKEIADMVEDFEKLYNDYKKSTINEINPMQYASTNRKKVISKNNKTVPKRRYTAEEQEEVERCNYPGCLNKADKNGLCTDCFLKGLKFEEDLEHARK